MRKTVAAFALAVGLLPVSAGVAQADDAGYLDLLHHMGECGTARCHLDVDDQGALSLGHVACQDITSGMTDEQVTAALMQDPSITKQGANMIRIAAKTELCRKR